MKKFILPVLGLSVLLGSCTVSNQLVQDDVYDNSVKEMPVVAAVEEQPTYESEELYSEDYFDPDYDYKSEYTSTDGDGNTYITNNYYSDNYDYYYSRRLRRMYGGWGCSYGFYDPYYSWNPYRYNRPGFSVSWGWGNPYNYGYNNFYHPYHGYGFGYPNYGYGNFYGYNPYGYGYNPYGFGYGNPYAYNPYFNNGYGGGYWYGQDASNTNFGPRTGGVSAGSASGSRYNGTTVGDYQDNSIDILSQRSNLIQDRGNNVISQREPVTHSRANEGSFITSTPDAISRDNGTTSSRENISVVREPARENATINGRDDSSPFSTNSRVVTNRDQVGSRTNTRPTTIDRGNASRGNGYTPRPSSTPSRTTPSRTTPSRTTTSPSRTNPSRTTPSRTTSPSRTTPSRSTPSRTTTPSRSGSSSRSSGSSSRSSGSSSRSSGSSSRSSGSSSRSSGSSSRSSGSRSSGGRR